MKIEISPEAIESMRLMIGGKPYRIVPEEEEPESAEERDFWQQTEHHAAKVSRVEQARMIRDERKEGA